MMSSESESDSDCHQWPSSSSNLPQNASASSSFQCTPAANHPMHPLLSLLVGVASPVLVILMYMMYIRRRTRRELEGGKCNLPTVVWRPRFMNYTTQDEGINEEDFDWDDEDLVMAWTRKFVEGHSSTQPDVKGANVNSIFPKDNKKKKLGSSAITNILPRMERLNGPYGMYATVYGIQTKVLHVAHPLPARAILTGAGVLEIGSMGETLDNQDRSLPSFSWQSILQLFKRVAINDTSNPTVSNSKERALKRRRSSSLRMLTGSTKYPAYDHFKNFSGEGVFTANGADWKAKRASVMHCLLRNNGSTERSLEMEANRAADSFEREVARAMMEGKRRGDNNSEHENGSDERKSPVMNVVPMLQRSTIGLIYRLITHHDVDFSPDSDNRDFLLGKCGITDDSTPVKSDLVSLTSSPRSSATSLASMGENTKLQNDGMNAMSNDSTASETAKVNEKKKDQIKCLLPTYLESVTQIRMIVLAQSRSFWYLLPRWVYKAFSPMYREEERTMGPIREFARLTCENAVNGSPLALLGQRESHSAGEQDRTINKNEPDSMTNISKDLLDEAITLLFAGQDTSAATLSWTLHLLSLHPDKQAKVAEEVRSVLITAETNQPILKGMISQMPYLDAVVKESMRLYPVAPFIVRKLTTNISIPIEDVIAEEGGTKTTTIPASTFACIWIYALHRNPKLWDRPGEFLPERWIDPGLRRKDLGQEEYGAYMPFAIGPRNCLGQPLAQVILRILLARILKKYEVFDPKLEALQRLGKESAKVGEFDPNCLRKDMQAGFTVLPSNGLKLQLMERR